jgi:hypothetical protein
MLGDNYQRLRDVSRWFRSLLQLWDTSSLDDLDRCFQDLKMLQNRHRFWLWYLLRVLSSNELILRFESQGFCLQDIARRYNGASLRKMDIVTLWLKAKSLPLPT